MKRACCHICGIDLEDERLNPALEYTCIFCFKQPYLEREAETLRKALDDNLAEARTRAMQ